MKILETCQESQDSNHCAEVHTELLLQYITHEQLTDQVLCAEAMWLRN